MFIINELTNNNTYTMQDLATLLNVNIRTIKRDIEILKQKGILTRIGPDNGGYWQINEETK